MVGFNRRFSPALQMLEARVAGRRSPLMIQYRLNAGYIPLDHWVHGPHGGGRNVGEACHMYDVFRFLAGAPVRSIGAAAIDPGHAAVRAQRQLRRDDPTKTAPSRAWSIRRSARRAVSARSTSTVFCDGEAFIVDDFKKLTRASDGRSVVEPEPTKVTSRS